MRTRFLKFAAEWFEGSIHQKILCWFVAGLGLIGLPRVCHGQVGYVMVQYTANTFTFSANPLDHSPNTLTNLIRTAPDGTAVYVWDVTNQAFATPSVFHGGWSINYSLPVGIGFVVRPTSTFTNIYVGDVLNGTLINPIAGSNRLSLVGSMVPQTASLTDLSFPGSEGDNVTVFDTTSQRFLDTYTFFEGFGWYDPTQVVDTNGPSIHYATSFFVQHPGPNTSWVRTFFINNIGARRSTVDSSGSNVQSLAIKNGTVTIESTAAFTGPYDVQFSSDRSSWKTVATNVKGTKWSGRFSGKPYGFYRLVKH